jgi:LysR family nitrogen assimilation transcriptional regulator
MDLQELRCFQHVANVGSFSRAAVQLGLAQPSLTRQIQKLEEELGTKLFYRNGRGVTLTRAGQRLLDGATELLAEASRLRHEIIDQARSPSGAVAIGMPPSLCSAIGGTVASAFSASYPDVSLRLYEHFSATLLEWVCASRLDLAVLYDVRRTPGLLVTSLFREHLFLVQAPGAAAPDAVAALQALAGLKMVLPCVGSGLRKVIQAAVMKAGTPLNLLLEVDSVTVIKQLVAQGHGATILPYGAVHREVQDGTLQAHLLDPVALSATLVTATPALQPITSATRALADILLRHVGECVAAGVLRGDPLGPLLSGLSRSDWTLPSSSLDAVA